MRRLLKVLSAGLLCLCAIAFVPSAAYAQAYPGGTTQERKPGDVGDAGDTAVLNNAGDRPAVASVETVRQDPLPLTGTDVVGLTVIGGLLIAAGVVIVRRTRPAQATA